MTMPRDKYIFRSRESCLLTSFLSKFHYGQCSSSKLIGRLRDRLGATVGLVNLSEGSIVLLDLISYEIFTCATWRYRWLLLFFSSQ